MSNYGLAKKARPFHIGDIFVYAALAVLIGALMFAVLRSRKEPETGNVVAVFVDGSLHSQYPIDVNKRYDIIDEANESFFLTLNVENKLVWVTDAKCRDHVCMAKRIGRTNDEIICLPNKIVIEIVEGEETGLIK